MGTAIDEHTSPENLGIVPRFIEDLFQRLTIKQKNTTNYQSNVLVSFLELYNEDFVDLLNSQPFGNNRRRAAPSEVAIREDVHGHLYWSGVREELCTHPDQLLDYLSKGSLCRTTGSTDMNSVSSRSHAIFSVILKQEMVEEDSTTSTPRTVVSKFHFVDLAGSERLKRTNAQGDRAREGIAINAGLLALGNVISALGDDSRRSTHIPYRDSKLTRLLQDSLGGNSQTLMMACVSPSDSNFMETLSTLKYANRARNIKNRVSVNQEYSGSSVEVNQLRAHIEKLKSELMILRSSQGTKTQLLAAISNEGHLTGLREEVNQLRHRVQQVSNELCTVTTERDTLLMERELAQLPTEGIRALLEGLQSDTSTTPSTLSSAPQLPMIAQYQKTIQNLRNELADTQERLTFVESAREPMMQALAMANQLTPSLQFSQHTKQRIASPQPQLSQRHRPATMGRKKRSGSSTTRTIHPFRSARLSKVHTVESAPTKDTEKSLGASESEDIEEWLNKTVGDFHFTAALDSRSDAREAINKARAEITKGHQMLDEIKELASSYAATHTHMNAPLPASPLLGLHSDFSISDIMADNEIFEQLHSKENMMAFELDGIDSIDTVWQTETEQVQHSAYPQNSQHSRMSSWGTTFSLDSGLGENQSQVHRMMQQLQSDIHIKEDLVLQLEKTESDYEYLRHKFEQKFYALRKELSQMKRERDHALRQPVYTVKENTGRDKQAMDEIRNAYEKKTQKLKAEFDSLRRKYSQTSSAIQSTRNQSETMMRALKGSLEGLKIEKKRMIQRMKEEAERTKDQMSAHDREIQQLRRKQVRDTDTRRQLERESQKMQSVLKKRADEAVIANDKLSQLVQILKKAVREGGVLDERLLSRCAKLLNISSAMVASSSGRLTQHRRSKKTAKLPIEARAMKKKDLLDRALYQFIQSKQSLLEMRQLITKRDELADEKAKILAEDYVLVGKGMQQFMEERVETIVAEISYLNARIHALQNDAAYEMMQEEPQVDEQNIVRQEKKVTFADEVMGIKSTATVQEDDWMDMDALEERYSLPTSADSDMAHDMAVKLLRSLDPEESDRIMEALIDDLVALRMGECNRQMTVQQLEKTVQDLRRALVVMKKTANKTTMECERKIKRLQESRYSLNYSSRASACASEDINDDDSAIDLHIEEHYPSDTIFDRIYNEGIRGNLMSPTAWDECHRSDSPVLELLQPPRANHSVAGMAPLKPSNSPLARRGSSMTSPEQFLQMLQGNGTESSMRSPVMRPTEFIHQVDRESSTSSIKSRHVRRSSIQSDTISWSSYGSSNHISHYPQQLQHHHTAFTKMEPMSLIQRRRANSFQQSPAAPSRRPISLREISLGVSRELDPSYPSNCHQPSPLQQQFALSSPEMTSFTEPFIQAIPQPKMSKLHKQRPSTAIPFPQQQHHPMHVQSSGSFELKRPETPSVFDRLASGHTRASKAKRSHYSAGQRHSLGSFEDIRQRWESNQFTEMS
ncbi:hypothetical protein BDF14DRAFT_1066923 [Spinellus fusiger]|nr:hypothetical protein BDF14DRAFT_1066923 [Spinellus fusiger]